MRNFREYKFNNDSVLLIILSKYIRGYKAHKIYYDPTEDEEIIQCFIKPAGYYNYNRI